MERHGGPAYGGKGQGHWYIKDSGALGQVNGDKPGPALSLLPLSVPSPSPKLSGTRVLPPPVGVHLRPCL